MIRRWRKRPLRLRLTIASFLLSVLVAAGAVAASVAVLHVEVDSAIRSRLQDRAAALVATIDTSGGRVDIRGEDDLLLDSPNWVFDGTGKQIEGSHPRGAVGVEVHRLGAATARTTSRSGLLHLLAIPVRSRGRIVAVAVTGVDEAPYEATLASITTDGALLGILAVLGATGLAALVLGRAARLRLHGVDRIAWRHCDSVKGTLLRDEGARPHRGGMNISIETAQARPMAATMLNKVPHVTLLFWLVKICSTTVGETGADFLNGTLGLGLGGTTLIAAAVLAVGLTAQFAVRRYIPAIYWTNVVVISVVGTLFSDNLVDGWGVPLALSTLIFALGLAAAFTAWYLSEHTLSIHTIVTRRREAFYWTAILFAFALGTSAGDWFAEGMALGYLPSAAIFAGAIAVVAVARFGFTASDVLTFWIAYVLTRPLGASLGDLFTQSTNGGGLGVSTALVSDAFLLVIVGGIVAFTVQQRLAGRRRHLAGIVADV